MAIAGRSGRCGEEEGITGAGTRITQETNGGLGNPDLNGKNKCRFLCRLGSAYFW